MTKQTRKQKTNNKKTIKCKNCDSDEYFETRTKINSDRQYIICVREDDEYNCRGSNKNFIKFVSGEKRKPDDNSDEDNGHVRKKHKKDEKNIYTLSDCYIMLSDVKKGLDTLVFDTSNEEKKDIVEIKETREEVSSDY